MFIPLVMLALVGLSGLGALLLGLFVRKGIFAVIGALILLLLVVSYEGYSVDTWLSISNSNGTGFAQLHTVNYSYPVTMRIVIALALATLMFFVVTKMGFG